MKKYTMALTLGLILTSCSASASAMTQQQPQVATVKEQSTDTLKTLIAKSRMTKALAALKSRVNKTYYVFSGWQPSGWDCSGLSMWFADQLGYTIPHSANKQARIGTIVKTPQPGDLVLFGYGNSFFHASVYMGNGKVIHAGFRKGQRTSWLDLTSPSVKNTKIRFVRLG